MKKLFLITIILLLQSFPSFGEWKELFSNSDGVHLIEVNTIRKNGNLIYYNSLTDFYEPQSDRGGSLSKINRSVVNCKTKKHKRLRSTYYFDSMGKGKITKEVGESVFGWMTFQIGSVNGSNYKFLCK